MTALAAPERKKELASQVRELLKHWLERLNGFEMPTERVSTETREFVRRHVVVAGMTKPYRPLVGLSIHMGGEIENESTNEIISSQIIPLKHRAPRAYLWSQSPFSLRHGRDDDSQVTHFPAVDYQIAYWLARLEGLMPQPADRTVVPPISTTPVKPTPPAVNGSRSETVGVPPVRYGQRTRPLVSMGRIVRWTRQIRWPRF